MNRPIMFHIREPGEHYATGEGERRCSNGQLRGIGPWYRPQDSEYQLCDRKAYYSRLIRDLRVSNALQSSLPEVAVELTCFPVIQGTDAAGIVLLGWR